MLKTIGLAAVAAMALGAGTAQAALVTLSTVGSSATFAYYGSGATPACAQCIAEIKVTVVSSTQLQFDFANKSRVRNQSSAVEHPDGVRFRLHARN